MRKLLVFALLVLLVAPAMAQRQGRSRQSNRQAPARSYSRQAPRQSTPHYRPARLHVVVVRSRVVVRRPYYRSYSYSYGGHYGYSLKVGLKFDLSRIKDEAERKMVLDGTVFVDEINKGIVDRFDGRTNTILSLSFGPHKIKVELRDKRIYEADIELDEFSPVVYLYPEFPLADRP